MKTIIEYKNIIRAQKAILQEQLEVIKNLLQIVESAVWNSKQLSLKAYEACLEAEKTNASNKDFVVSTSLFVYGPGFGPGCVDSGIAQQKLLDYTYSQLDYEIGKVISRQKIVPKLYLQLKEELQTIGNVDYAKFSVDETPEIEANIAIISDPREIVTLSGAPMSLKNSAISSSAIEMQTNVYYILSNNTLVCGKFKKS